MPDDEAFIYTESGHEKLCLITGFSIVVTKTKIKSVDIRSGAAKLAREMLNDKNFNPKMEY